MIHAMANFIRYVFSALVILLAGGLFQLSAQPVINSKEKAISLSIEINAPIDSVWARWTTASGRSKFFAPASKLELSTLGFMEILFNPNGAEGQRGAENNRVLAFQDKQFLSFTWDAPPMFPEVRKQRTVVTLRFHQLSNSKTLLVFHQLGWGSGQEWDAVYDYFTKAWANFVLPNLKYSLEVKPIDWNNLPQGLKPATIIKD